MGKENKKDLILSTFKQSILKDGYSKVSINSLTSQCNISKGSFYTYFSSKDEILSIVIDEYKALLKRIMKDCTELSKSLDEFLNRYIKYRLTLNDEELELELVLVNLFKNLEILGSKNLNKIYKLTNIHIETIEENLKKYIDFPEKKIKVFAKMIEGTKETFQIKDTIEINDEIFRIKNLDEVKKRLISDEVVEDREFIIKNIKKMLNN